MTRRIIIDLDETAYNLHEEWCKAHNIDFPDTPLCPEHIISWNIEKYAANGTGIFRYLEREELFSEGLPIPGAIEVTKEWISNGIEVGIATRAITPAAVIGKTKWLANYMPHIKAVFMLLSDSKWWIDGDIFVDDAPLHLENVRGIRIMYNQPHNQHETRFIRVNNWHEVKIAVRLAMGGLDMGFDRDTIEETIMWAQKHKLLGGNNDRHSSTD